MNVTTKNLFILAWLDLILCVCPSLGQGDASGELNPKFSYAV